MKNPSYKHLIWGGWLYVLCCIENLVDYSAFSGVLYIHHGMEGGGIWNGAFAGILAFWEIARNTILF